MADPKKERFEQAYRSMWRRLYYICYSRIGDQPAALDLVQEVFKSIYERLDEIDIDDRFDRYLIRAIKFKLSSYYRSKALREEFFSRERTLQPLSSCDTEERVAFSLLKQRVNTLVGTLPTRCQEIYLLSREQGLSNRQISEYLCLSEKTVENQLTKALALLKKHLLEKS